ncbi:MULTISPECIES: phage tail length tape measure family protein [unclassified Massilia]|uniref:phage tail length tape measure family protein n=1 Tax=unclassified Massilia TaxID=2609279 RepID=UPI0017832316|nr:MULTISPECIES: phage tail length tape measure family protein [unclassified Massilia]MBD8531578.1 phage tail length tape measure family protein [Massilia sp. CFBP 13647]MBD8673626.1 phage tail length tape measure family protein [Massilia sp. CFBP 13721]
MSETRAVVLETQVNTTGARTGFNEIVREAGAMAGSVQRASQQADRAVEGIGGSASTSARSVEVAQRNLVNSIQRTTAAMEAGGKTGSAYYEVLARQRGVDPAVLEQYLVQLRAVEQAQAQAARTLATQQAAQQQAAESAKAQAAAQRELAQAHAGRESFISGLREQIALFGKSTEEVLRYRAAQAGAAQESSMLILQLQNMRAAQGQAEAAARAQAAAQREAAQVESAKGTFLDGLREQIALFGRSTEGILEYRAAQLGAATAAAPLIAQLRSLRDAHEQAAGAARLTAQAQKDALQAQGARDSFLSNLREQIALFGKSADEVQRYRAAQMGAASAAEPLIAQMRALQTAQDQVTASARAAAQAQQDAAQAQSRRDSFLDGLREQIALYGRSTEEVQRHHAALLGLTTAAEPLITQLHAMRVAQEQVAAAARAADQAQREATQMQAGKDSFLAGLREQIALFGLSIEEVQRYRAAQMGLTASADPLIAQLHAMRTAQEQVTAAAKATAQAQREADQVQAGKDSFIRGLEQQAAALGKTRIELLELQAAQMGVTSRAQPFINQLRAADQGLRNGEMSAAALNAALRQTPAQITDIVVSLQGGQAPLTVFLQQGGQLRDMFGSFGGAAKAIGSTVLGMITPVTVAAAAVGTLAYAYSEGAHEAKAFGQAIVLSNNAAGTSINQLMDAARGISDVSKNTQGAAAEALQVLVDTGAVSSANLQRFAAVAVETERVLDKAVKDTAAEFADLRRAPLEALQKLGEKYHFVTAATYAQVKALQDEGRQNDAAALAQSTYAEEFEKRNKKVLENMGALKRGWMDISTWAKKGWDAILDIGRKETPNEEIGRINNILSLKQSGLAQRESSGDGDSSIANELRRDIAQLLARRQELQSGMASEVAAGAAQEKALKAEEVRKRWLSEQNILLTRQDQLKRDLAASETEGRANGLSEEEIQTRLLVVRRKYNDVYTAGIDTSITALRNRAEIENTLDQRALARLQAQRSLGAISEDDAITKTAAIEVSALDRQKRLLQDQLGLVRSKINSQREQADLEGQIAVNRAERRNREEQRDLDLEAARRRRADDSSQLYSAGIVSAQAERTSLLENVRVQREYNEEIGLTGTEAAKLRQQRVANIADLKDEAAAALEAIQPGSALAQIYRDQAAAIRAGSAAERDGFTKSRDPYVNLRLSLKQYGEEATNVGGMVGDALTNGLRSAEDAFANFVTTGKLNFRDLATSIIADFARIQAKSALSSVASSLLGSIGSGGGGGWTSAFMSAFGISGARAAGGPVSSGLSYLVGEKGPEIFTPSSTGAITPNHMIGAGGGSPITIQTNVQVTAGGASSTTTGDQSAAGRALADMIASKAKEVIVRESRQGGLIWNMKMGRG